MKRKWLLLLLATLAGIAGAFSFRSDPTPLYGFTIGPLILLALRGSRRFAAAAGFCFGVGFQGASLLWVYEVMHVHGHLQPIAAVGVLALMVAYLALYPGVFSFTLALLAQRGEVRALLTAPFLWVALEYAQTHAPLIGFPWNLAGYSLVQATGLMQLAAVTGIYGLSFVSASCGALLASVVPLQADKPWRKSRLILAASTFAGLMVFSNIGSLMIPAAKADQAAVLVQLNFPQAPTYPANWMDVHAGEMDELERNSVEAAKQKAGLIIWPEVPAPFYFLDPKFAARAERIARDSGAHFLVGVVEWKRGAENRMLPYNSAVLLDASGKRVFQYDKIHLVPFGEYVPLRRWLKFAESLVAEVGDFRAGTEYVTGELPDEPAPWETRTPGPPRKFGVSICYEAIFPNEVRQFVANGADLLVNISNDGWLGRSAGPDQHLAMARVRAVENRRWLLRATNNGYTVSIDPYGRIVAQLATDVRGVLRAPFSFRSDRTIYSRFGDWFAWMCVIMSVGFLLMRRGKAESKDTGGQDVRR